MRKKLGLKAGFPRFKKYGRYKSITYPQSGFKIEGKKLRLSKIGLVNIKLHRPVQGVVKTLTIKRMSSGKWFAIFSCKITFKPKEKPNGAVGIDVGLHSFAVLSDRQVVENPQKYRKSEKKLAVLQRRFSRKKQKSGNREKARIKVAQLHEKIANQRNDFLHKTSRKIADSYSTVFVEDLQIPNMMRNHKLAKSIADASWGRFIQMLFYKAEEAGGKVVKVEPQGTTQKCSRCGLKVPKTLTDRIHACPRCGLEMDRDLNASRNILKIPQELREFTPVEIEPLLLQGASSVAEAGSPYPSGQGSSLLTRASRF
jgi:putative transposase